MDLFFLMNNSEPLAAGCRLVYLSRMKGGLMSEKEERIRLTQLTSKGG